MTLYEMSFTYRADALAFAMRISELRAALQEEEDLDAALFLGMKWIIRDKIDNNRFLHPDSIKMFNYMLKQNL